MADMEHRSAPVRLSALSEAMAPGTYGTGDYRGCGVTFTERHPLSIVQIEARTDQVAAMLNAVFDAFGMRPDENSNRSCGDDRQRILWTGPNRWLSVMPDNGSPAVSGFDPVFATEAAVVDLSHGRAVIRISGRSARSVLMKGSSLDWHPRGTAPDSCAQTALFHIPALIDCRDIDVFDLYAARGYARSLWHHVADAAAEYGYQARRP